MLKLQTAPGVKLKGTPDQHNRLLKSVTQAAKKFIRGREPFQVDDLEFTVSFRKGDDRAEIVKIVDNPVKKPKTEAPATKPDEYSTVAVIKAWLDSKGIEYKSREKKADLLKKIK